MDLQLVKQQLLDNPELIRTVLEDIGCHHTKIVKDKRVQAALPYPHDNVTSVQISLNDMLSAKVRSKNDYDYEIKDIFTLIQYVKGNTLAEAIGIVCKVCGIEYTTSGAKQVRSSSYDFLKKFKRSIKKEEYIEEEIILPESFTGRFVREDCKLFSDDGVSSESQNKFGVSYDLLDNRVVFPIRNEEGELLSFKGRCCNEDYKINGIPKFISYYPCSNNNYLFGYYENFFDILAADEIYATEAEKGTMQLDTMGINNAVATNKKIISPIQVKKFLKLGKSLVLLFDKDVTLEMLYIECAKFSGLIKVSYVFDTLDLLKRKQSPTDCGIEVFQRLIDECKYEYVYKMEQQ
ncbi:hypothetical protein [Clostridium estertheticum]|uniref:hypothetical protein n=1 Tax=Clostridium estertheticum TaxID=238834 RepID=UPI001C0BF1C8|nr:hypothetical protein [Clostridium estertheticum]MBU3186545.1 hypothetical protein [Clostridium estertheticum]